MVEQTGVPPCERVPPPDTSDRHPYPVRPVQEHEESFRPLETVVWLVEKRLLKVRDGVVLL